MKALKPTTLCLLTGVVICTAGLAWWWRHFDSMSVPNNSTSRGTNPPPRVLESPRLSTSPYQNTVTDVEFVGSSACVNCHVDESRTYLQTAHSQSLSDIQLDEEPPNGEFKHTASGRTYRVYREGQQLRHRESIESGTNQEIILSDFPVRYAIGSGRFSRSYLIEIDGFLVESPITRYASTQQWGMSPGAGYDHAEHWAFERAADIRCVNCHVDRVEAIDQSFHRLNIHEQAIGCERCHGPGAMHVKFRSNDAGNSSNMDQTIVHPGRLPRSLQESICGQCHHSGAVSVDVRDRRISEFRPGLPLSDFRIAYQFESAIPAMKVVGHMEQMRLSACYTQTDSLTCTTCHDLHNPPPAADRVSFYRSKCLTCHGSVDCALAVEKRTALSKEDNCVKCHMPQVPTDIPHFAFTHHRIGIHPSKPSPNDAKDRLARLVPIDDVSHLSKIDQQRNLGMAYALIATEGGDASKVAVWNRRALELLGEVREQGLDDPEVDAMLSNCCRKQDVKRSIRLAASALRSDRLSENRRVDALWNIGSGYFDLKETDRAIPYLEKFVRLHRHAEAWLLLDICRYKAGDRNGSIAAAQNAARISPYRADLQGRLAQLYREAGRNELADTHQKRMSQLLEAAKSLRK